MAKALSVWWDEAIVGTLSLNKHGDMRFLYDTAWLTDTSKPGLSVSLPKRVEPFTRRECRPFFEGLLPEESQRDAVARALGVSRGNAFKLLEALGGEVAGALTLWPEGEAPPQSTTDIAARALSDDELLKVLDTLPLRPMLAGEKGIRLSLAGAQTKLPVVLINGSVALPALGQPTTHILKPPIDRFIATTENEAFSMRLAARMGLSVAPVEVRLVTGHPFLLIERYDRHIKAEGKTVRLHQEDFCQALGVIPDRKYAAEGGPTFKSCFDLVRRVCTRPAVDVLRLLDAAITQVIIGNADAHGKNYSLLYRGNTIELSPLYDLLCTVTYPEVSPKFAMKIAKQATLDELRSGDWDKFAADVGLGAPFVRRRIKELAGRAQDLAQSVVMELAAPGLNQAALGSFANRISGRAQKLVLGL
jgi:serine/threonine-protein kinase HipA